MKLFFPALNSIIKCKQKQTVRFLVDFRNKVTDINFGMLCANPYLISTSRCTLLLYLNHKIFVENKPLPHTNVMAKIFHCHIYNSVPAHHVYDKVDSRSTVQMRSIIDWGVLIIYIYI